VSVQIIILIRGHACCRRYWYSFGMRDS